MITHFTPMSVHPAIDYQVQVRRSYKRIQNNWFVLLRLERAHVYHVFEAIILLFMNQTVYLPDVLVLIVSSTFQLYLFKSRWSVTDSDSTINMLRATLFLE